MATFVAPAQNMPSALALSAQLPSIHPENVHLLETWFHLFNVSEFRVPIQGGNCSIT